MKKEIVSTPSEFQFLLPWRGNAFLLLREEKNATVSHSRGDDIEDRQVGERSSLPTDYGLRARSRENDVIDLVVDDTLWQATNNQSRWPSL